jgi:SAM-dependent methyltransferase
MKDNFSEGAREYALFRPDYPDSLIRFLLQHTKYHGRVWDCGTGSGQLAVKLSPHFGQVIATDISEQQLAQAPKRSNIIYKQEVAEEGASGEEQFDLITVAQAIHWFRFDAFYKKVYQALKPEGLFAIVGYNLPEISPEIDVVIRHFYKDVVGSYWDAERRYVDEMYATIPFPFDEIPAPRLQQNCRWKLDHLTGYINTWSAVKHYQKARGRNPVALIKDALIKAWGADEYREVSFPILLRAGRRLHHLQ